jgi:hypothetical protein
VAESEPQLVDDWILHAQTFWAATRASELSRTDPKAALDFILEVKHRDPLPRVLANPAAGPLEDLLVYQGPAVIDRVEALAAGGPGFPPTLSWRMAQPDARGRVGADPGAAPSSLTSRTVPPNPCMQPKGRRSAKFRSGGTLRWRC